MGRDGCSFTVICWASGRYKELAAGMRQDCERLGYPWRLYDVDEEFPHLVRAWCNHPRIIRRGVEEYGCVLFLDVECRILAPIPSHWRAPLISIRSPNQKFWIRYNSGTVMADETCLPWLDAWIETIERWDMANLDPGDFIHWPGDVCDELALAAALACLRVDVNTPRLEYVDRTSDAEISRGLWQNRSTIIQHPTIHHWPKESDPVECKKLFVQNFSGDPAEAEPLFARRQGDIQRRDWIFDTDNRLYAPREYWPAASRPWIEAAVSLTAAQR
jgi:hypothetical protein